MAPFQEVEEDDIDPGLDDEEDYEETDEGYNVAAQNQRYGTDGQGNGPYYGGLKGGVMENSLRLRGGLVRHLFASDQLNHYPDIYTPFPGFRRR